jgi:hypothetical protein
MWGRHFEEEDSREYLAKGGRCFGGSYFICDFYDCKLQPDYFTQP